MKQIATTVILGCILISVSFAGITMTSQFKDLKNAKAEPTTQTTYLEKDLIRMDMKADKSDISIIFRGDKELFWMVDHKKKSYTEITKEDLEAIQKAAQQAIAGIEEAMKELPSGLSSKLQGIMQSKPEQKSEIIYNKVAVDQKVNQWVCEKYEGTRDDKKEIEVWTTEWKKLGLTESDLTGFSQMGNFFTSMMKNMTWYYNIGPEQESENMYIGFPVKTVNYEKDKAVSQYEITEIKQEELKEMVFEAPTGYKKEKTEINK
jgi:hypothetical protein